MEFTILSDIAEGNDVDSLKKNIAVSFVIQRKGGSYSERVSSEKKLNELMENSVFVEAAKSLGLEIETTIVSNRDNEEKCVKYLQDNDLIKTLKPSGGYISTYDEWLVAFMHSRHHAQNLETTARQLSEFGYKSRSGLELTGAHISNFARKEMGMRKVGHYEKPNYKGRNWLYFSG